MEFLSCVQWMQLSFKEIYELDYNPINDALANHQFSNKMKIGDYILIKRGTHHIMVTTK
ncbi:hypothetical protein [Cytobacillus firmus]|uniref:hypothetical protein n=1 Tax=Cytobacillus firmus TaxID=1399 RepID=UPI0018CCFF5A|nr:hypothetical protein [Cytobacillus firmus]